MVSHKGGSFSVNDAFAKKVLVLGEIPLVARSRQREGVRRQQPGDAGDRISQRPIA
jgi:hypothetical protein